MDLHEIIKKFSIITGLSDEEVSPWTSICEDACLEIRKNLREDADEESNSRRLNAAAAALAFYRYVLYCSSGGGVESFTTGEIRVKTDAQTSVKIAYTAWIDAKRSIADILKDEDFMFERIV